MYFTPKNLIDKIYVYLYNAGSDGDLMYSLLDYKKDLLLLYSLPFGNFYQYDSHERGQAYFDTLIAAFNPYIDYLWRKRYEDTKKTKMNPENPIIR